MDIEIREKLYDVLSAIPTLADNVFPLAMPQDTKTNSVCYSFVSNRDTTGVTCNIPVTSKYLVQIDIFANTYAQSVALLDAVKTALRENFIASNVTSFETYENITIKYRQILTIQLENKG